MKRIALVLLISMTMLGLVLAWSAPPVTSQRLQSPADPLFEYERLVVRAYYQNRAQVAAVAMWTEPWEVNEGKGYLVVEIAAQDMQRLVNLGLRVEVDESNTAALNRPLVHLPGQVTGIPGYPCYRTVEETFSSAQTIAANYPHLATWIDTGDSWEKQEPGGADGYDMMVLRLTNNSVPGPKPKIFIMSAVHAREYATAELNTRLAEHLVANYGVDADVTWLLDYHEFHLMLQANPDGRKKAETGLSWRKNANNNFCSNSNSRGVDLNRNYPFEWGNWGGSSGVQCDLTYRGPSAASESETQAVTNYVRAEFPDQRLDPLTAVAPLTATGVFLDVHAYGQLLLWSWGFTSTPPPNNAGLQTFGRKMGFFNGYEPKQGFGLYPTDGTTKEFAYGELGMPGYTVELGTSFFQDCGIFENTIVPDNIPMLLYAAKAARTPYLTPKGPDAANITLSAAVAEMGTVVTLTASADDTRYNNVNGAEPTQSVAAAEYYMDIPPWVTTTVPVAFPMAAIDGSFNSSVEGVTAAIDTTPLSAGRHTIYVRSQDTLGDWGAVSARFLYVVDPAIAPVIEGHVLAADTGLPLTATVSAGVLTQVDTDPATGAYQMQVISGTYDLTAVPNSPAYAPATVADVNAWNEQVVRQDFALCPYSTVFSDDVESGNLGWTATSPWAISGENVHGGSFAWSDSPGGNYSNYRNVSLTSPVLDLSGQTDVTLNYWQICDTEAGYDYCRVEVSADGGGNWQEIVAYDGSASVWEEISLSLPMLDDQATARIRFRFTSDQSVTDDGWHVDDIRIDSVSASCGAAPQAAFAAPSPVAVSTPVTFTNNSLGLNTAFQWDFGDGSPVVTDTHPVHFYLSVGTYTAVLTAANQYGSSVATSDIEVLEPPQAAFTVAISGTTAVFTNTSTGTNLNYQWDFGDGSAVVSTTHPTYLFAVAGTYTVTLQAGNGLGSSTFNLPVTINQVDPYPHTLYIPVTWKES